jgi:hypothetical protein
MSATPISRARGAPPDDRLALVSDGIVEAFWRDGAVWIENLLSPAWLRLIAQGVERNLRSPGPLAATVFAGEPGEYRQDYVNYWVNPEYQRLLADSPIAAVMAKVLRSDKLWLFCDQIFVKEGASRRSPWHQDIPWLMSEGQQQATMWIAIEPLAESETLEVVAGSHRGPVYDHLAVREDAMADVRRQDAAPPLPDIDAQPQNWPIIRHASQPGDVLIFHPQILHGGAEMAAGGRRRSLSLRLFGDDVRYAVREAGHDPEFPGVAEALRHGDPLRHPWFPMVWPRSAPTRLA